MAVSNAVIAETEWYHLEVIEEQFYHQISRVTWLRLGDQNTTFYHNFARNRISHNVIRQLETLSGTVLTDPNDIKREAVEYFQEFLQAQPSTTGIAYVDYLADLLDYRCSSQSAQEFCY